MAKFVILPSPQRRVRQRLLLLLRLFVALLLGGTSLVQLRVKSNVTDRSDHKHNPDPQFQSQHGLLKASKERLWWSDTQAAENVVIVEEKRQRYRNSSSCRDGTIHRIDWFVPPQPVLTASSLTDETHTIRNTRAVKACRKSFLDLGANVGDSLGKLIDAGVGSACTARYNVTDGWMYTSGPKQKQQKPSKLTQWIAEKMRDFQRTHQRRSRGMSTQDDVAAPEQYCYYGVEGNPVFTERLTQLQHRLLATQPRPVRSIYFFTETVASGHGDGPTTFYLDTVNVRNNYFGSSLLATHTDVRHSAEHSGRAAIARTVNGMTLSTLLRQVVRWEAGAHLLVKMDIEGAEYAVLNEAWDSKVLCDVVASGVRVDVRVEIHPKKTIGENADLDRFKNTVWGQLKGCGVNVEVASDAG